MKFSKLLIFLLIPVIFSSCSRITLQNIDEQEFSYKYSKITLFGNQKKINKTYTVEQACDFTEKYISLIYNRSFRNVENKEEKILFSKSYTPSEGYTEGVKNFYTSASAVTEVSDIKIKNVIMVGGDAYVNAEVNIILKACESDIAAKSLGFPDGIGSTQKSQLNLKLIYENNEYKLYDISWVEEDGYLLSFEHYGTAEAYNEDEAQIVSSLDLSCNVENAGEIRQNTEEDLTDIARIGELKRFINNLASKQNNRDYKTLKGNEDYPLLSDEYIAKLNSDTDDITNTKNVYSNLKLSTKLTDTDITNIEVRKDGFVVTVNMTLRMLSCISDERAKSMGFTGGIGSDREMTFVQTVKDINGSFKLVNSQQTK